MERAAVAAYLSERFGKETQVDRIKRSAGGLSRETWFIEGPDTSLVFRCDLKGGASSCPVPLTFEYEMHRRLPELGLPVTRALWFEHDAGPLGQPFYVRDCVQGSSTVPGLGVPDRQGEDILIEASREHIRKMAQVHLVDWRAAGLDALLPAPGSGEDSALATVARIEQQHRALGLPMSPMVARAFSWFREHAPKDAPAPVLCKGSNGALQEVWDENNRIVALCDWELASIGDPANDWGRCLGLLPDLDRWTVQDAMDYYRELTGITVTQERLDYYRGIYALEMINVCQYAGQAVRSGKLLDIRLEMLGSVALHHSEMTLRKFVYG